MSTEIKLIFKISSQCINLIIAQLNKSNFISFIVCKPELADILHRG